MAPSFSPLLSTYKSCSTLLSSSSLLKVAIFSEIAFSRNVISSSSSYLLGYKVTVKRVLASSQIPFYSAILLLQSNTALSCLVVSAAKFSSEVYSFSLRSSNKSVIA